LSETSFQSLKLYLAKKDISNQVELKRIELEIEKTRSLNKIIEEIIPKLSEYFEKRMVGHETPILKQSIWIFFSIIILIVLGTGFLVYTQKLDTTSFTFLIGTVLGYLLTFSKTFWKKESD
jgi:hypothetical protein